MHDPSGGGCATRIERLRIKGNFIEQLGFPDFFKHVSFIEIINAFQYDRNNFLSLARIKFEAGSRESWRSILEKELHVKFVQELSVAGSHVECIIQSTSAAGFFPLPVTRQGSWAIIPPITMDPQSITLTIIAEETTLPGIHATIEDLGSEITVLALDDLAASARGTPLLAPAFTDRQREVATYAARRGFFDHPKKISTTAIASHFGISVSALTEHLRKARQLAMMFFFG